MIIDFEELVARHDWNENDPTKPGYIKNRPFYTGNPVETVFVEESTVPFTDSNHGLYIAQIRLNFAPTVGEVYKVSWDGTVYECTCVGFSGETVIGNLSIAGAGSDTGEPFVVGVMGDGEAMIYTLDTSASHIISISGSIAEVVKIDEKYLPDDLTSKISTLSGDVSELSGDVNTLSNNVSTKMDKTNPTGSGSFSLNRKANTIIGANSFAEGDKTTASGEGSHAEGSGTVALGNYSHAEGDRTTALGSCSHAEGGSLYRYSLFVTVENPTDDDIITAWSDRQFSVAKGARSHVEGNNSLALGDTSHAEGYATLASGEQSHAEGHVTITSGYASHAEGYQTTASSDYQHVQGKYNIEDPSGIYADIVGNGAQGRCSNAYTLDWEGNAWYSGTIEGKALILPSSTEGSTKKFKITVDDSGAITATEIGAES